jgi:BMFP domain-containing protein YqiC
LDAAERKNAAASARRKAADLMQRLIELEHKNNDTARYSGPV